MKVKNDKEVKEKQETKLKELVFLYENGKAIQTEVITGIQDNEYIEIKTGLKIEQEVICGPYSLVSRSLRDQTKVTVIKKEELYTKEK